MSLKGSPINWWKEKRQASHSGIPAASRPATAFPWAGDNDLKKIVQDAVLDVFESDAFKLAISSQVNPTFTRHQEKLNQIKTANLNLESTLQTFVEEFPAALRPIQDQLTALEIPEYGTELEALSLGQKTLDAQLNDVFIPEHDHKLEVLSTKQATIESKLDDIQIPNYEDELNEISTSQARLVKLLEHRFSGLESRIEDLDRRFGELDESTVNADLRSAIRFGELSNELQDRNAMLGDRLWGVERDLGKKIDGQQRKYLEMHEELGKASRNISETLDTMQATMSEDRMLLEVKKASSRAESAEKTLQRHIIAIQGQVSNIETSVISLQSSKLDAIDSGMSEIKTALELSRKMSSLDSQLLSTHTSKLEGIVSVVGKVHMLAESTNEISQKVSELQKVNATSARDDMEMFHQKAISLDSLAVSHAKKLEDAVSNMTRMEQALLIFDTAALSKLGALESTVAKVEQELSPLSSHSAKLDNLQSALGDVRGEMKPHKAVVDDLSTTVSEMRAYLDTRFSSCDETLSLVRHKVEDTSSLDTLVSSLSEMPGVIEENLSSALSTIRNDTSRMLEGMEEAKNIAVSNKDHLVETLSSNAHTSTMIKEDIASLETKILQTLETNFHTLEEISQFKPVAQLSAKVDEFTASNSTAINDSHKDLQSASRSTTEDMTRQIQGLYGDLSVLFESLTKATDLRVGKLDAPIATILDEFQSIKAISAIEKDKITDEFQSIKSLVEASQVAHVKDAASIIRILEEGRKLRKDDEILLQLESWEQNWVSKQTSDMSVVTLLLDASRARDEAMQRSVDHLGETNASIFEFIQSGNIKSSSTLQQLEAMKSILEDKDEILSIKQSNLDALQVLNDVQLGVQKLTEDPTAAANKQLLLQNISLMATAQDGITAIDTKITKSEEVMSSAVQQAQTALQKHIVDTVSSGTTTMYGDLANLRNDIDTKISTATSALVSEVKGIDPANAIDSLNSGLRLLSTAVHDSTKLTSEDIESRITLLIGSVTNSIKQSSNDHTKLLQENGVALSQHKDLSATNLASISEELAKIQESLKPVSETREDVTLIIHAVEKLDQKSIHSAEKMVSIHDTVSRTDHRIDGVSENLKNAVTASGAETLQAVETIHSITSNIQQISNELLPQIQDGIKAVDATLVKSGSESEATKTAIISSIAATSVSTLLEIESTKKSAEAVQESVASELQDLKAALVSDLSTVQKTLQSSLDGISSDLGAKLEDAAAESKEFRNTSDANLATLSTAIHHEAETTLSALEALRNHVVSEVQKSDMALSSILNSVKADIERVSSEINTVGNGIRSEIKSLDDKTASSFIGLETANGQAKTDISNLIGETRTLTVSSFDSVSGGLKAIEEAVEQAKTAVSTSINENRVLMQSSVDGIKAIDIAIGEVKIDTSTSIGESKALMQSSFDTISGGIKAIDTTVGQVKTDLSSSIEKNRISTQSNFDNVSGGMKAIEATVGQAKMEISNSIEENKLSMQSNFDDVSGGMKAIEATVGQAKTEVSSSVAENRVSVQSGLDSLAGSIKAIDTAVGQAKMDISSSIEENRISTQSSFDNVSVGMKAIEATVGQAKTEVSASIGDNRVLIQSSADGIKAIDTAISQVKIDISNSIGESRVSMQSGFNSISGGMSSLEVAVEQAKVEVSKSIGENRALAQSSFEIVSGGMRAIEVAVGQAKTEVSTSIGESRALVQSSIDSLSGGVKSIETAIGQSKMEVSNSIGENSALMQSSFDSVSGSMRAIDAAVRVNSAAIARVDKAVLETGSQVKSVVHDGNREVLSQLDEQLFESGTRIKGLSNFDIPRIEAIGKRNRDILEVIGTRVVGTGKKFEELMALHLQKPKAADHSESLNGRLRGGSNASSSRDSGLRMSTK